LSYDKLQEAAAAVAETTGRPEHSAAVVLGSGLSDYATSLSGSVEVPYEQIPHFPMPRVEGHAGSLFSVPVGEGAVLLFAGRVHTYEGWDLSDVVFAVRTAATAGCSSVVLTNAAGGLGTGLAPGDLVAIKDHLNLTGRNPLLGDNDPRLGPRFPDLTDAYDPGIRQAIAASAGDAGVAPKEGVYAWMLGPSYESPAEIQFLKRIGADLVGMSTVPEAIALRHMGVRVGGISLVTNLAAGISATPLSHEEVTETATLAREKFTRLLDGLLPRLLAAR
jgi:purine-nucleoside phosphorylase